MQAKPEISLCRADKRQARMELVAVPPIPVGKTDKEWMRLSCQEHETRTGWVDPHSLCCRHWLGYGGCLGCCTAVPGSAEAGGREGSGTKRFSAHFTLQDRCKGFLTAAPRREAGTKQNYGPHHHQWLCQRKCDPKKPNCTPGVQFLTETETMIFCKRQKLIIFSTNSNPVTNFQGSAEHEHKLLMQMA